MKLNPKPKKKDWKKKFNKMWDERFGIHSHVYSRFAFEEFTQKTINQEVKEALGELFEVPEEDLSDKLNELRKRYK